MLKKHVFLMGAVMLSLALLANAEAGKPVLEEVNKGPMDKFVTRIPSSNKRAEPSSQDHADTSVPKRFKAQKSLLEVEQEEARGESLTYLSARVGWTEGLTRLQQAWLTKID